MSQGQGEEEEEGEEEEGEQEGEEREEEEEDENEEEEQPSSPESGNMEWRCRECKKRFAEREDYIDHMKNDHGTVGTLKNIHEAITKKKTQAQKLLYIFYLRDIFYNRCVILLYTIVLAFSCN